VTFPEYLLNIVLGMNPLVLPLYLIGLGWVLVSRAGRRYASLGILFLVTLGFLYFLQAKYFMLAELLLCLLAAGSAFVEDRLSGGWLAWRYRYGITQTLNRNNPDRPVPAGAAPRD
jgi:hypothetical protein